MPESHASQLGGPLSAGARLIGFVSITDPERARQFYAGRLGLEFEGDDGFALVFRSGGTMVRAAKVRSVSPSQGTVLGWEVDDIVDRVRALSAAGIEMERFTGMPQDELGIWDAPGGSRVAWFQDPDGNRLSVSQH